MRIKYTDLDMKLPINRHIRQIIQQLLDYKILKIKYLYLIYD